MDGIIQTTDTGDMIDPDDFEIRQSSARGIGGYSRVDELGYHELQSQHGGGLVEYPLMRDISVKRKYPINKEIRMLIDDPVKNKKAYAVGKWLAKRKNKAKPTQKATKKKRGATGKKKSGQKVGKKRGGKK
jgi:hypothetical protein